MSRHFEADSHHVRARHKLASKLEPAFGGLEMFVPLLGLPVLGTECSLAGATDKANGRTAERVGRMADALALACMLFISVSFGGFRGLKG